MTERKTAVTETVSYETTDCQLCETEVAVDRSAPADSIEPRGFAVVIGEGDVTIDDEESGNWETSVSFEFDESHSTVPKTTKHVICEQCARVVHDHPTDAENYYGRLSAPIAADSPRFRQLLVYTAIALGILILLLLVL